LGKTREISVSLVCHRSVAPFLNMKFILHNYLIEEEFRSQNQLVGDSDPSPIEDHQIFGGSL